MALFPYDNRTLVVENFNDEAVSVHVVVNQKVSTLRNLITGEQLKPAELNTNRGMYYRNRFMGYADDATVFELQLPAHSYIGLKY